MLIECNNFGVIVNKVFLNIGLSSVFFLLMMIVRRLVVEKFVLNRLGLRMRICGIRSVFVSFVILFDSEIVLILWLSGVILMFLVSFCLLCKVI